VATDRPAGLRLPPMIDHGNAQALLRPQQRVGVAALAGKEQRPQLGKVILLDVVTTRIVPLDGTERRRRGEERVYAMLRADAPERARIGRANRFSLVEDGRASLEER